MSKGVVQAAVCSIGGPQSVAPNIIQGRGKVQPAVCSIGGEQTVFVNAVRS